MKITWRIDTGMRIVRLIMKPTTSTIDQATTVIDPEDLATYTDTEVTEIAELTEATATK